MQPFLSSKLKKIFIFYLLNFLGNYYVSQHSDDLFPNIQTICFPTFRRFVNNSVLDLGVMTPKWHIISSQLGFNLLYKACKLYCNPNHKCSFPKNFSVEREINLIGIQWQLIIQYHYQTTKYIIQLLHRHVLVCLKENAVICTCTYDAK